MIQIQMQGSISIDIGLNISLKQDLQFVINLSVKYKNYKERLNRFQFLAI
jgi:hypothetical protein